LAIARCGCQRRRVRFRIGVAPRVPALRSPRPEVTPQALDARSDGVFPGLVGMEVMDVTAEGDGRQLALFRCTPLVLY
jgi:hypothetical protein